MCRCEFSPVPGVEDGGHKWIPPLPSLFPALPTSSSSTQMQDPTSFPGSGSEGRAHSHEPSVSDPHILQLGREAPQPEPAPRGEMGRVTSTKPEEAEMDCKAAGGAHVACPKESGGMLAPTPPLSTRENGLLLTSQRGAVLRSNLLAPFPPRILSSPWEEDRRDD